MESDEGNFLKGQRPASLTVYDDRWFTAKGTLCDRTIFRLNIDQRVHEKKKIKRHRTQVTERITEKVTLLLRFSPDAYPNWSRLTHRLQADKELGITDILVKDCTVRVVAVTKMMKRIDGDGGIPNYDEDNLVNADMLLKLFTFVYSHLQKCRAERVQVGQITG